MDDIGDKKSYIDKGYEATYQEVTSLSTIC
jgi:hypothetical protein